MRRRKASSEAQQAVSNPPAYSDKLENTFRDIAQPALVLYVLYTSQAEHCSGPDDLPLSHSLIYYGRYRERKMTHRAARPSKVGPLQRPAAGSARIQMGNKLETGAVRGAASPERRGFLLKR